jgi:hypothetical protein
VVYGISRAGLATLDLVRYWYSEYTSLDGLSGGIPSRIYYDRINDLIFIAYESGLVDYFNDISLIRSYRDIQMSQNFSRRGILDITSNNSLIYFATEFGIVVFDIRTRETRFTYRKIGTSPQDEPVTAVGIFNGRIYAVVAGQDLFSASLDNPNLADGAAWQLESGYNNLPTSGTIRLAIGADRLFASVGLELYQRIGAQPDWEILNDDSFDPVEITKLSAKGNTLAVLGASEQFDSVNGVRILPTIFCLKNGQWNMLLGFFIPKDIHVLENENDIAIADLVEGTYATNIPQRFNYRNFTGNLPNNLCQNITVANRQLYVAPSGHNDFNTNTFNSNGIYYMDLRQREWRILSPGQGLDSVRANSSFGVLESVSGRPEVYASSWDNGIIRLSNGRLEAIYDTLNSCLTGISTSSTGRPLFIRAAGLKLEPSGRLWAVLNNASRPIAVIESDGTCYSYPMPPGVSSNLIGIAIDDNGYKWITIRRSGLLVYDDNRTIETNRDDRWIRLRAGAGLGGLASDDVRVVKPDRQSSVWVGTSNGISVYYNPAAVMANPSPPDATCPIFNFLCLLEGNDVVDIEVDGANQKWIATASSGVFFFNADGTRQIQHFTSSNSPLPSNSILDIAIDHTSGEVFFATAEGIVSYQAVATEGSPDNSGIEAFPNPVFLDDFEYVLIRGMAVRSSIRIMSESGQLVRELVAQGGQALWDGRDSRGTTVAPGVYFVLAALETGESPGVFKIAVLKRRE